MTTSSFSLQWNSPKKLFCFAVFFLGVTIDQVVKNIVVHYVAREGLFPDALLNIHLFYNSGIAFGIPLPGKVLALLFFFILLIVLVVVRKEASQHWIAISFLFAGTISNILDRFLHGAVIDYVEIWIFPVFNIADVFIIGSIAVLIVKYYQYSLKPAQK